MANRGKDEALTAAAMRFKEIAEKMHATVDDVHKWADSAHQRAQDAHKRAVAARKWATVRLEALNTKKQP